jgi:hypothetical protein
MNTSGITIKGDTGECIDNNIYVQLNNCLVINKFLIIGDIKLPYSKSYDFSEIPKNLHQRILQIIIAYEKIS